MLALQPDLSRRNWSSASVFQLCVLLSLRSGNVIILITQLGSELISDILSRRI